MKIDPIKKYFGKPLLAYGSNFNISSGFLAGKFRLGLERHTICCIAIIIYVHGGMAQLVGHFVKIPILSDVDVNEVLASRSHN